MTFRVYSGPRGAEAPSPLRKETMLHKEFMTLDEAMNWARHISASDHVPLLIEGDDGTHLTKTEIFAALSHPESRLGR